MAVEVIMPKAEVKWKKAKSHNGLSKKVTKQKKVEVLLKIV